MDLFKLFNEYTGVLGAIFAIGLSGWLFAFKITIKHIEKTIEDATLDLHAIRKMTEDNIGRLDKLESWVKNSGIG